MKSVLVVDYGMGNLHSVHKALEACGANVIVSNERKHIEKAERIVLPGVGSFGHGIMNLRELNLSDLLTEQVIVKKKPFLGICLGMQLAAKTGHEHGEYEGLGWINAHVRKLDVDTAIYKVPHMGWDDVEFITEDSLFEGIANLSSFYFVHSYHFIPDESGLATSVCSYGKRLVASLKKENIHLVQFHPEKSQKNGLRILSNFLGH